MTPIISKRHKLKFYLTVALSSGFFVAIGCLALVKYQSGDENTQASGKMLLLPFVGFGLFLLAIYFVYKYFKNAPVIVIDDSGISFNGKVYPFSELEHIDFTGKRNFPFFLSYPLEAATLQFKSGEIKYIFDDMYENAWEMKSLLHKILVDKKDQNDQALSEAKMRDTEIENFETFKGNAILSLRGLALWGLIGFVLFSIITSPKTHNPLSISIALSFFLLWFFLSAFTMDYFKLSSRCLIVKNHYLPWRSKSYPLDEITEIVFETYRKMPNGLRVIKKNFKTKLYLAGTLTDRTWISLKNKLESYNIHVRNECIYEKMK